MKKAWKGRISVALFVVLLFSGHFNVEASSQQQNVFYYNVSGGKYYHVSSDCKIVDERFRPMKAVSKGELVEEPLCRLNPCPECIGEETIILEDGKNQPTPEMLDMLDMARAAESGDFYKWSLDDKAKVYPFVYEVPTEQDMSPDEAIGIAVRTVMEVYGISQDEVQCLTPYLFFYPSVSTDGDVQHCYFVQLGNEELGYAYLYGVEIASETKTVLQTVKVDKPSKDSAVG